MTAKPLCDISTGIPRPWLPEEFRKAAFPSLHGLSHPGINMTQKLIVSCFIWPNINSNVQRWTKECLSCQKVKVHCHTSTPLRAFNLPQSWFSHVHIKLVGLLPPSNGFNYILTCNDRFTHWPKAIPISNASTPTIVKTFLSGWITRFGVPSTITTGRGAQFQSHLWQELSRLLGTKHISTTAYHPIAYGTIEQFHRQLKASLKSKPDPNRWTDLLPMVLLGLRSMYKEDLQACTAELDYGTALCLPGQFFDPHSHEPTGLTSDLVTKLKQTMRSLKATPTKLQSRPVYINKALDSCTHVFIRQDQVLKRLDMPYKGPYRVLTRADKYFELDLDGRRDTVSLDRLKPAFIDTAYDNEEGTGTPTEHNTTVPETSIRSQRYQTRSGRTVRTPNRYATWPCHTLGGGIVANILGPSVRSWFLAVKATHWYI